MLRLLTHDVFLPVCTYVWLFDCECVLKVENCGYLVLNTIVLISTLFFIFIN